MLCTEILNSRHAYVLKHCVLTLISYYAALATIVHLCYYDVGSKQMDEDCDEVSNGPVNTCFNSNSTSCSFSVVGFVFH